MLDFKSIIASVVVVIMGIYLMLFITFLAMKIERDKMDASAYAAIIIAIAMSIIAYGAYIIGKKNDKKVFSA